MMLPRLFQFGLVLTITACIAAFAHWNSLSLKSTSLSNGSRFDPVTCWFENTSSLRVECGYMTTRHLSDDDRAVCGHFPRQPGQEDHLAQHFSGLGDHVLRRHGQGPGRNGADRSRGVHPLFQPTPTRLDADRNRRRCRDDFPRPGSRGEDQRSLRNHRRGRTARA